jgi:hypothetical protein
MLALTTTYTKPARIPILDGYMAVSNYLNERRINTNGQKDESKMYQGFDRHAG